MNIFLYHPVAVLIRRFILRSAIVLCCYSANALADESAEVQALKLKVEVLRMRVKELEAIKTPKLSTKKARGSRWDSLSVGLSKSEVASILGKPGKIDKWKTGEAWYFPNPRGGEVDFDTNGKVTGWLEP
ncbi:MAG: hypothetical protein EPN17_16035 [Methylobacter sp.]|nr:MAG: hypothetical protein EPN17_16035 [Methylobacter sp.]